MNNVEIATYVLRARPYKTSTQPWLDKIAKFPTCVGMYKPNNLPYGVKNTKRAAVGGEIMRN